MTRELESALWVAVLIGCLALALYVASLCPTVWASGTGENAVAAAQLGVPHPPGFPLFCWLGRLAVVVGWGAPAAWVSGVAALGMALAAAGLAWWVCRWTGLALAGGVAGGALAVALVPWQQAVIPEVYGCSAALAVATWLAFTTWAGLPPTARAGDRRWWCLFAYLWGLGTSVHPLHALFAPAYAWMIWSAPAARRELGVTAWIWGIGAFFGGLSVHLYAPIRSAGDPALDWGNPETLGAAWNYWTAAQYRERMFGLAPSAVLENAVGLGRILANQWWPPVVGAALLGGGVLLARQRRLGIAGLAVALATLGYAANYDIPWEIEVYTIPATLLLAASAGFAVRLVPRWLGVALAGAVVVGGVLNAPAASRRQLDWFERYGRDVLASVPEHAVLVTPNTNPAFVLLYLREVLGERPDVEVYVDGASGLGRLGHPHGAERRRLGSLAASGRPLYFAVREPLDDLPGWHLVPAGAVYRALNTPAPVDPAGGGQAPITYPYQSIDRQADWHARVIAARYWVLAADRALAVGDTAGAHSAHRAALAIAPERAEVWSAVAQSQAAHGWRQVAIESYSHALGLAPNGLTLNRLGRLHLEAGDLDTAEAALVEAVEFDPSLAVAHSNLGALRGKRGDLDGAVESLERALAIDPAAVGALNNLGLARFKQGDPQAARRAWERSLTRNPQQPRVRAWLAGLAKSP